MKISLVSPPFIDIKNGPPIGLAYLSSVLKKNGYNVKIIDLNIEVNRKYRNIGNYSRDFILPESHFAFKYAYRKIDDYSKKILSSSPDIVGFSLSSPTEKYGTALAKKVSKYVHCIAGGPHVTFNAKSLLESGCFDSLVIGYGEEAVLEALHKKGMITKDLDKTKEYFPDYSDLPINKYKGVFPVITSRGCPHRCNFCTQHFPLHLHSIDSTVNLIKNTPKIREVMYNDSNINIIPERTEYLFAEIAKLKNPPPGHIFGLEIKQGFEKYIPKMASAGVKEARVGIESGSIRERKSMNKPRFDNDIVIDFIKELNRHHILTWAQFIFCYPNQTENDRGETLALMKRINNSCNQVYIRHIWNKFVVHDSLEELFKDKYNVTTISPSNWQNSIYTPDKIEKLAKKYSSLIPLNAKILM